MTSKVKQVIALQITYTCFGITIKYYWTTAGTVARIKIMVITTAVRIKVVLITLQLEYLLCEINRNRGECVIQWARAIVMLKKCD